MFGRNRMTLDEYKSLEPASMKNPARQAAGRRSHDEGAQFEDWLSAACEYYSQTGVACIEKTPEPMKPIRRLEENRFVAVYTGKAQNDYKGTLTGGRAVAFEAKHTGQPHILQNAVTQKQADALDQHYRLGAVCFIMVSLGARQFFRVPWAVWKDMSLRYGRKYMRPDDLAPFEVPVRAIDGQVMVLFLDGIKS